MSTLVENVQKVKNAHAALKTAIAAKGVAVPEGTKLTDMPALVEQISTEPVPTNPRAVFAGDESTSLVVPKMLVVDIVTMTNLRYCFYNCSSLTTLVLPAGFGQAATTLRGCFQNSQSLKSLTLPDGFGQNSTNNTSCFAFCTGLTTITGNPNFKVSLSMSACNKLTHDSIMVVINGLQTVTTTQKLTLGETNLAKLTEADKKIATDKGWTLA